MMASNKLTTQEEIRPEPGKAPNIRLGARQKHFRVFEAAKLTAQAIFEHTYRDQLAVISDPDKEKIVAELERTHKDILHTEIRRRDITPVEPVTASPGTYITTEFALIKIADFIGFANDLGIEVTVKGGKPRTATATEPTNKTKVAMLKIIAGLASSWITDIHSEHLKGISDVTKALDSAGAHVDEKVLRRLIKEGAECIEKKQNKIAKQ